jgi:type II secretory ATPase GspE/PulE/Tfp pilus assembly ATPase PilB-like protein
MRLTESQEHKLLLAAWCRRLALLLDLSVPVLQALEISGDAVGELAEIMLPLCARVRMGEQLSEALGRQGEIFSPFFRAAVLAGEHADRLPQALRGLAEILEAERLLEVRPAAVSLATGTPESPPVRFTHDLLARAAAQNATELHLAVSDETLTTQFKKHGRWQPQEVAEIGDPHAVIRRLLMLADIPYWIREPAVGALRLWIEGREYSLGVRAIPRSEGGWERVELDLHPITPEPGEGDYA